MEQHMREYEEYKVLGPVGGWIVLIIFSFLLISFGMFAHMFIMEPTDRKWDTGAVAIAPGETRYTTMQPSNKKAAVLQMQPIPGAYPDKRLSQDSTELLSGKHNQ